MRKRSKVSKSTPRARARSSALEKQREPSRPALAEITGMVSQYRVLSVILLLSIPLAFYEASNGNLPSSNAEVRPEWLFDRQQDLAATLLDLYPSRSQGYFLRAYQASMCWDGGFQHPRCEQFPNKDLRDVKSALEEAIERGATDQEQLLHFYAFILVKTGAPEQEIDAAIRRWRINYPNSTKPDPRQM